MSEGKTGCWVHGVGKNSLHQLVWSPGVWRNLLWVSGRGCVGSGDSSSRVTYWMCGPAGVCLGLSSVNWSPHREPLAEDVPSMGTSCSSIRPVPHGSIWVGPQMWWEKKMACLLIPAAYGASSHFYHIRLFKTFFFFFSKGRIHKQSCLSFWLCRGSFPQHYLARWPLAPEQRGVNIIAVTSSKVI